MKSLNKFVTAIDCWYPCFPDSKVSVSLIKDAPQKFRVAVWGADDMGMEKEFTCKTDASQCFDSIPVPVSKAKLTAIGFVTA